MPAATEANGNDNLDQAFFQLPILLGWLKSRSKMRHFRSVVFLVLVYATIASAASLEDAEFAYERGDYTQAARLFRPFAEQGVASAQFNLGVMYAKGQGVPQDYPAALKWFQKAAEQGDPSAQNNLGLMYERGRGVRQDFILAHMWSSIAAAALNGDEGKAAIKRRDYVASHMTAAQIEKAEEMARRCQETKFKMCE
jgi:hypothetical protein